LTLWLWYAAALASLGPLVQLIARSDVPEAARHDRSTDECTNPLRPIAVAATFKAADSTPNAVKALNTRVAICPTYPYVMLVRTVDLGLARGTKE